MFTTRKPVAAAVVLVALAVIVAPAQATQPECRVENVRSETLFYNSNTHVNPLGTAISEASAGDTLKVIGTCRGNFVINKDLTVTGRPSQQQVDTIRGTGGAPVLSAPEVHLTVRYLTVGGVSAEYGGSSGIMSYGNGSSLAADHIRVIDHTGSGIFSAYGSTATIDDSIISNNRGTYGNGVYTDTDVTIRNSVVSGNQSGGNGAGIFARGALRIEHSVIEDNDASRYGGGVYLTVKVGTNRLTVVDSTIRDNSAGLGGGGVVVESHGGLVATASLVNSTLTGNTAPNGGGIYNLGTLTVESSTVTENVATTGGGGIFHDSADPVTLTDSSVTGNVVTGGGAGGIQAYGSGPVTLTRTTVSHNSGGHGGIWTYYTAGTLTLDDAAVTGNAGNGGAGGIYAAGVVNALNSTVSDNSGGEGGGFYIWAYPGYGTGTVSLTTSTVTGNTAVHGGGAYLQSGALLTLTDSSITGNAATSGGGIYGSGTVTLNGTSSVCDNTPDDWPDCSP